MIKYHTNDAVVFYEFSHVFYGLNMVCVASLRRPEGPLITLFARYMQWFYVSPM